MRLIDAVRAKGTSPLACAPHRIPLWLTTPFHLEAKWGTATILGGQLKRAQMRAFLGAEMGQAGQSRHGVAGRQAILD